MTNWDLETRDEDRTMVYFARGMRTLWGLLGDEKKWMGVVVVLTAVTQVFDLAFPYLLKHLFDQLPRILARDATANVLILLIVSMLLTRLLSLVITRFVREPIFLRSAIRLENGWPVLAQEKLLALSMQYHERENIGKKVAKINKGCEKLVEILMNLSWGLLPALLYLLLNVIIILAMDWRLGLLFFLPLIPACIINFKGYVRFTPAWISWEEKKEVAHGLFCQSLINIQTVQGFVQETRERNAMRAIRSDMEDLDIRASIAIQRYHFAMGMVLNIFFILTVVVGIIFVRYDISSIGTVVYIIATGNVTLQQLWQIVDVYSRIMRHLIAAERMKELLDEPVTINNSDHAVIPDAGEGIITFDHVVFRYTQKRTSVLHGVSITLRPGEMLALVGRSGSGKTTIVKLLARVYDVGDGSITLDALDIRHIDRDWYRRRFAIVQQDVDVFDASIRANVTYAYPAATDKEVQEALAAAHFSNAMTDVGRFPNGLDTEVGERGVRLSGGERQRVGIARAYIALLHGARVLILDEATSSLDSEAERAIQTMIGRLRQSSHISIVAIAHRLSTIQRADTICVVEDGRIIETGNHARLMSHNGLYAKLVGLQHLGELRD